MNEDNRFRLLFQRYRRCRRLAANLPVFGNRASDHVEAEFVVAFDAVVAVEAVVAVADVVGENGNGWPVYRNPRHQN